MKFVGIDLAWTYKNETGMCIIADNGEIEYLSSAVLSNVEIVDLIKSYCHEPVCVAIDAPLIVKNETGSREAERSLMRYKIHGYNLSLFVASRSYLTRTFGEIRGEVLLNLIMSEIPDIQIQTTVSEGQSTVIETFPSAVCCGVFPELYPVKYKVKRKVPYQETKCQIERLLKRLKELEEEGIVSNLSSKLEIDSLELTSKNHKHIEDMVDAFLSAYSVFSIYKKIAAPMVFGDVHEGFITIPIIDVPKSTEAQLIILRGNSGSGKSTTARMLQRKFGRGTLLIPQDTIRREMLWVKDEKGTPAVSLLIDLAKYGKQNCQVVIVEGILYSDLYRELFKVLKAEFRKIHAYYYDIPFEETSIRHQTKPISNQFGEKDMRDWWRENDYIGIIPEKIITEELEIEEIVEMIYRDVMTDD